MLLEEARQKKSRQSMIPFLYNSKKCKLIYSNRKHICSYYKGIKKKWGGEEMGKKITEGALKKYVRSDGYVYYLGYGNGFAGVYI